MFGTASGRPTVKRAHRLGAALSLGALLGVVVASSVSLSARADLAPPTPQPNPTGTGVMGALSSQLEDAKKQAANAPRAALSGGFAVEDAGPPSTSAGSGASSSGGDPTDTALKHDLPTEADLDESLPERRAKAQASLARHLSSMIGDKPVDASLIDELRRHARVIARLDRIGFVASEQKDDDAMKRVTALLSEEFELHASEVDRWLGKP